MKLQLYIKSRSHSAVVGECWWKPAHSAEGQGKARRAPFGMLSVFRQLPLDLDGHDTLDEIIIREIHHSLLSRIPSPKGICESPQFDTAGDVVIKGDLPAGAVPLRNESHSLRVQPKSHGHQGLLQLLRIHRPTPVAVKADEVLSPAIQHRPELLKFIESHGAGHISIQH